MILSAMEKRLIAARNKAVKEYILKQKKQDLQERLMELTRGNN